MRALLHGVVDDKALQPLGERGDKLVVDAGGDDQARGCGAALASGEIGAVRRHLDRHAEIGVVDDDQQGIIIGHLTEKAQCG